jgi:uncharacterized membrane protein YadS
MTQNVISAPTRLAAGFRTGCFEKPAWPAAHHVAVALTAYFVAPSEASRCSRPTFSLKDFILAIIFGIAIRNTVGVADMFQPGLRYSTILTKTGIVVMGSSYSLAGLVSVGAQALVFIAVFLFATALTMMWLCRRLGMSPALGACLAVGDVGIRRFQPPSP